MKLVRASVTSVTRFDPREAALKVYSMEVMEKVAIRAKDSKALQAAVLGKLEAQREFAAGYQAQCEPGKRNDLAPALAGGYCERFGFALRTVQRWCSLLDVDTFEKECGERLTKTLRLLEMETAANYSSESVEWYTPRKYLDAAHVVLGEIDLDPASSEAANKNVNAKAFFSEGGLEKDWFGTVFLNPPYGKCATGSMAAAFCNKAIAEYSRGRVTAAILLVNSVHSQEWQAPLFDFPICLVDHRIEFISHDGQPNENPTFQNMFVYLGSKERLFADFFSLFGYVLKRL